ncbi:serine hydrolase domain-containing protein [Streptacidiphilus griseoplanus]|uniref:serine hydrolase domain-containing protein n=1 Tax=Peterkaempfera griseoplana TaxID=66896 RepID=UPI0006E465DF|nr:serine hydrolase domain-containing protein [Peterkaempfera griseoplana]
MTRISEIRPARRLHRTTAAAAVLTAAALGLSACAEGATTASAPAGRASPVAAAAPVAPGDSARHGTTGRSGCAAGRSHGSVPVCKLTPALADRLDKAVRRVLAETGLPGAVVGLWTPQGRYVRAFGVADMATRKPMTTRLRFRVGSITKTFTVTALLELVDRGRAHLDDPISRYVSGVPGGDRITLRQLAEMRSGLFSYTEDPDFDHDLKAAPKRAFTPRQLLAYAFRHPAIAKPGTVFQYSNTNTVLLGLAVEKLSSGPLGAYLRSRVFRPARLRHTTFPAGAEFPQPHADGYTTQSANGQPADATDWNPSWGWSAGAAISDLDDMRTWAGVLAKGSLLRRATQAQRLKLLPTGYPGTGYGLGVFGVNGWVGHNGSLPGYESVAMYLPSARATLVVLVNTDVLHRGAQPSTLLAEAVTALATPRNVYRLPSAPTAAPRPASIAALHG